MNKITLTVLFAILLSGLVLLAIVFMKSRQWVPVEDAKAHVAKGALLLDVRTPDEFAQGHLPDAVNIPVAKLPRALKEVTKDPLRPVVVYCRSGQRSSNAKTLLLEAGMKEVHDLGPMARW